MNFNIDLVPYILTFMGFFKKKIAWEKNSSFDIVKNDGRI